MNVLFVNPPNQPFSEPSLLIEPIDVLSLATFAGALGCRVRVRDMDREQIPALRFGEVLDTERPDCVVIPFDYHVPLYTGEAAQGIREMMRELRTRNLRVILGGRPASFMPALFLDAASTQSVIVKGEMEEALAELLSLDDWSRTALQDIPGILFSTAEGIHASCARSSRVTLDQLPIPDRGLVSIRDYIDVRSMLTSRGCVERCSFCPVRSFWGDWRCREASLVVDEIEYLAAECGARKVIFLDDHAAVSPLRLARICQQIRSRRLEVALGCLGTPRSFDPATLGEMRRAGFCWIHIGAESGSERVLKELNKRSSPDAIRSAISAAKAAGLRVRTSWILDPPPAD